MKINIKREEVRRILEHYFKTEIEDFSIEATQPSTLGKIVRSQIPLPYEPTVRIPNVKKIRELVSLRDGYISLLDAKWAIDNWDRFIQFVDEYNRYPLPDFGRQETLGKLR